MTTIGDCPTTWRHIHFEVYGTLADATGRASALATSQLAIPEDACNRVYDTDGYARSVTNLASLTLRSDQVFADGVASQLATATGSAEDGNALRLTMVV